MDIAIPAEQGDRHDGDRLRRLCRLQGDGASGPRQGAGARADQRETQKEEGEKGGGVPGRKSAAETEAFLSFPPSAALYYQTLPHTKAVPSPANFQEVEKIFIRNYTAMMAGEISIADGVQAGRRRSSTDPSPACRAMSRHPT